MNNPYDILGITPSASNEEVKQAYRALAKKYHPDNYIDSPVADVAERKMQEINWAYDEILKQRAHQYTSNTSNNSNSSYSNTYSNSYSNSYSQGSQNQGAYRFSNIRSMINNGEIDGAEQFLDSVRNEERNAEWYFLKGCIFTRRGYIFDAIKSIDKACSMDPNNQEYRTMRENLRAHSNHYGNQPQPNNAGGCDMCDVCSTLICLDCLCNHGGCC